ncbi:MAG TPA: nickel-binding protein [Puia sp.]|nr:nickel-binding protein [Puia sp.]
MPIYMDRHDILDNVTAAQVAEMHQQDLKIQDKYGCRGLTYWFDGQRQTAFCLIEAPDISCIHAMHNAAHGQVPNRVIEVSPALVEAFLGRIEDPEKNGGGPLNVIDDSAFRILMLVSLKPATTAQRVSKGAGRGLEPFNLAVHNIVLSSGGKPVRRNDHHLTVCFTSAADAVRCALRIQAEFEKNKTSLAGSLAAGASLKIGVSAGDPVTDKPAFFEDAIRLVERMCRIVKGEIILSCEVRELYDSEKPGGLPEQGKTCWLLPADQRFLVGLMDFTESAWKNAGFKVDDFEKALGCSKSQFYRKMISLTGKSPNFFLKEYRLNEALGLLNKHARNVSEVAFETGFNSPSYFSKCFQQLYGCLPSDYLAELAE